MENYDINHVLIELIKKHPNIYDKSLQSYKNNIEKNLSWAKITLEFNNKTGCLATGK